MGRKWDVEVSEIGKEILEFYIWFKKVKVEECKRNFLKLIWIVVGFGNLLVWYINNNNELYKSVLKCEEGYKK